MTLAPDSHYFLVPSSGVIDAKRVYRLASKTQLRIGNRPDCDICVTDDAASGHHALIAENAEGRWCVYDLGTSNGTYLNGAKIRSGIVLEVGDKIRIGASGPTFVFTRQISNPNVRPTEKPRLPGGAMVWRWTAVSEVLPVFSRRTKPIERKLLTRGILVVLGTTLLSWVHAHDLKNFPGAVAIFLVSLSWNEILNVAGRMPSLYGIALSIVTTWILASFFIHNEVSKQLLAQQTLKQLVPVIPVLAAVFIAERGKTPWRERLGVFDPLDAIVLGLTGAACLESVELWHEDIGRVVLVAVGDIAGQMAYSGYFGYMIGLTKLHTGSPWRILFGGAGWAMAVLLSTVQSILQSHISSSERFPAMPFYGVLTILIGFVCFALLITTILRARITVGLSQPLVVQPDRGH